MMPPSHSHAPQRELSRNLGRGADRLVQKCWVACCFACLLSVAQSELGHLMRMPKSCSYNHHFLMCLRINRHLKSTVGEKAEKPKKADAGGKVEKGKAETPKQGKAHRSHNPVLVREFGRYPLLAMSSWKAT